MSNIIEVKLRGMPRPRIRVAKNGGRFYPKEYKEYVKELTRLIEDEIYKFDIDELPLYKKGSKVTLTIRFHYKEYPKYKSHDADSLAGAVMDALNGLVYEDDSLVVRLLVEKKQSKEDLIRIYTGELV
jgi:Holliday junction resolvase RusA-like endonuclease